ncbi:MAG: sugar O-acetyltransferase [Oscillospiraceae bacterium]
MTTKKKMLAGKLYIAADEELARDNQKARRLTRLLNSSTEAEMDTRPALLRELFRAVGTSCYIEPPFRCDYGCNITIGDNFYANYDCIMIDVCPVTIGNNVFFGPRVGLYTAGHPIDAAIRATGLEFGAPISIGNDVWIGGGVIVNPGVTIGSNVVIGSGSVVTRDLPNGVVAAGNPCRVLRQITEADRIFWEKQRADSERD